MYAVSSVFLSPDELPVEVQQALDNATAVNPGVIAKGVIGVVALVSLGLFLFWKPETAWELQHLFSVQGGEPTDFYLFATRASGVIFILMGAVLAGILIFTLAAV